MPWTGTVYVRDNGVFTGPLVWTDDRDAGTKITAQHHDTHDQDIADGISACINRSGANAVSGDINWGGFKIVNQGAGVSTTDSAIVGQTVTAASLNPSTNVLTLTRSVGDVSVDLSALAVGGSTSDFARYSNALNPFQGSATFAGTLGFDFGFSAADQLSGSGVYTWTLGFNTSTNAQLANTSGATFTFAGNSGTASLSINGAAVWTTATLPPSTFANVLTASGSYTITGGWTFTNTALKLVPFQWSSATGGGNWVVGPDSATQLSFTDPGGLSSLVYVIDPATVAGAYLSVGDSAKRVWDRGNLPTLLSAAPSDSTGEDGDGAFVVSGADKGVWVKVSGTWIKIAS